MKTFLCFQNDNKSHLCQGNCRNMDWNGKVLWITSLTSITKTKVTFVKKIAETLIEIANCYEELPCFQNEKKSHLCQGNRQKMHWNSKGFGITSVAPITTKKNIYVKKIAETWMKIANCYEELLLLPERKRKLLMWIK